MKISETKSRATSADGIVLAERLRREWAHRNASGSPAHKNPEPQDIQNLLFSAPAPDWADRVARLFTRWETDRHTNGPDLIDLVRIGFHRFGIDPESVYAQAAGIAALLGETDNPLDFHNPVHHRKVLFHGLRLIEENNRIFRDNLRCLLAPEEIALAMTAICIHDLMHDGKGNGHGDSYVPGRLEQHAFDLARPWLHAAGLDTEDLLDLEVVILSTEVTPLGEPSSPARQLRQAYAYHFQGGLVCEFSGKMTRMQGRRDLVRIGMLLHSADIANSAGVSPAMSRHETALFMQECGFTTPMTDLLPDFLKGIGTVLEQFEPARTLYNPQRQAILNALE